MARQIVFNHRSMFDSWMPRLPRFRSSQSPESRQWQRVVWLVPRRIKKERARQFDDRYRNAHSSSPQVSLASYQFANRKGKNPCWGNVKISLPASRACHMLLVLPPIAAVPQSHRRLGNQHQNKKPPVAMWRDCESIGCRNIHRDQSLFLQRQERAE